MDYCIRGSILSTLLYDFCSRWWSILNICRVFDWLGQICFFFNFFCWKVSISVWMSIEVLISSIMVVHIMFYRPPVVIRVVVTPIFLEVTKSLWICKMVSNLNLVLVLLLFKFFPQAVFKKCHLFINSWLDSFVNNFLYAISEIEWDFI